MKSTNAKKEYFKKHHVQCFNIWTNIENISKTPIKNPKKLFLKSWKCVYTSSFEKLFQRWKVVDAFNFEKSWVFKVKSTLMYGFGFNDEISTLIKLLNIDQRCNLISTIPQRRNDVAALKIIALFVQLVFY